MINLLHSSSTIRRDSSIPHDVDHHSAILSAARACLCRRRPRRRLGQVALWRSVALRQSLGLYFLAIGARCRRYMAKATEGCTSFPPRPRSLVKPLMAPLASQAAVPRVRPRPDACALSAAQLRVHRTTRPFSHRRRRPLKHLEHDMEVVDLRRVPSSDMRRPEAVPSVVERRIEIVLVVEVLGLGQSEVDRCMLLRHLEERSAALALFHDRRVGV